MSHMVIYRSADGKAGFQQVDDLTAAVAFVEKIRNAEGVENSRIYRMEQVNYRFEPYYQVRLETGELLGGPYAADPRAVPVGGSPVAGTVPPPVAASSNPSAVDAPAAAATIVPPDASSVAGATNPARDEATTDPGDGNGIRRGLFR